MKRQATITRKTKETEISATVDLDGTGAYDIATGIGFLDHMLEQLARHSLINITLRAKGDLHIDYHHTAEDTGIVVGQAIAKALEDKAGIVRYADVHLPMDETLTRVALDVSGRPFLVWKVEFTRPKLGEMDTELFREWLHRTPASRCTSKTSTARTITISQRPAIRGSRARSRLRSRSIRGRQAAFPRRRAAFRLGWAFDSSDVARS